MLGTRSEARMLNRALIGGGSRPRNQPKVSTHMPHSYTWASATMPHAVTEKPKGAVNADQAETQMCSRTTVRKCICASLQQECKRSNKLASGMEARRVKTAEEGLDLRQPARTPISYC